jgi:hypothetical protein
LIRRTLGSLIGWYDSNWVTIASVLPFIQLRDESDRVIDGNRELFDRAQQL